MSKWNAAYESGNSEWLFRLTQQCFPQSRYVRLNSAGFISFAIGAERTGGGLFYIGSPPIASCHARIVNMAFDAPLPVAQIGGMAVQPEQRRRRYATRLLHEVEAALSHKVVAFMLIAAEGSPGESHAWKCGYRHQGTWIRGIYRRTGNQSVDLERPQTMVPPRGAVSWPCDSLQRYLDLGVMGDPWWEVPRNDGGFDMYATASPGNTWYLGTRLRSAGEQWVVAPNDGPTTWSGAELMSNCPLLESNNGSVEVMMVKATHSLVWPAVIPRINTF